MKKEYWIGIVVAALVVVGVVVGISLAGGGDDDAPSSIEGAQEVQAQLEGVPQAGNVLGEPDAPVEIIEYGDLACPACQLASETLVPEAIDAVVKPGEAKMVFQPVHYIQTASSERGAFGAEAAGFQDAMWSFVSLIYRNQGPEEDQDWLTDALMEDAVGQLGLDVDQWRSDYTGDAVVQRFDEAESQAREDRVAATPTFVVRGPRGEQSLRGVVDLSELEAAVAEVGPQT